MDEVVKETPKILVAVIVGEIKGYGSSKK